MSVSTTFGLPWTHEQCSWLCRVGRFHRVRPGEVLVAPGAPLEGFYLVFKGRVSVGSGLRGPDSRASLVLGPGDVFGQSEPGEAAASPLRARALDEVTVIHLDALAVSRLFAEHMALGSRFLQQQLELDRRLRGAGADGFGRGKLLAVYGPRGGAGASTAAVLAAGLAAERDARVLVLDLHRWYGEVAPLCDLQVDGDVVTWLAGDRDLEKLRRLVGRRRGFDVLAGPQRLEDGEKIEADGVRELLALAVEEYDLVIVDLPSELSDHVLDVLEWADHILLPLTADFEGLLGGRKLLGALRRLDIPLDVVEVLLNRYRSRGGLEPRQLREMLGLPVRIVSEDQGQLLRLANDGRLLDALDELGEHPLVRATRNLVEQVLGLASPVGGPLPELYQEVREFLPLSREGEAAAFPVPGRSSWEMAAGLLLLLLAIL